MFVYSKGSTINVIESLDTLEAGAILLSQPGALLDPEHAKRAAWGRVIARAMQTGGTISVLVKPVAGHDDLKAFRGPLPRLPDPYRTRVFTVLAAIATLYQQEFNVERIDCMGA